MSWIAEYDTQGREFPTCVHVTKTTGTMTHGATYVPIEDGKAVRAENAKLRELVHKVLQFERAGCEGCPYASTCDVDCLYEPNCPMREDIERDMRELEVDACPNCGAKVVEPTTNDVDVEVEQ